MVLSVTRGEVSEKPDALDMEQVAVEEIFSEADKKIAYETSEDD